MNVWKKIGALTFVLIVALALSVSAFASSQTTLPDNDAAGAFTTSTKDQPTAQQKILRIYKDITAFNPDASVVAAPTITYKYEIAAGSADKDVTDVGDDHNTGNPVTLKTLVGAHPESITMTSETNSTAAATTTLAWDNNKTLTTAAAGSAGTASDGNNNTQYIDINFGSVVFSSTGVYRYSIAETVSDTTKTRASSGVTGTDKTLFLDVYVKPVDSGFSGGTAASDWVIYGYSLFASDDAVTSETAKLTGFKGYDKYYTTNVTVSKDIESDAAMVNAAHEFPFMVEFTNSTITESVKILVTNVAPSTTPNNLTGSLPLISGAANTSDFTAGTFDGTLKIGENTTGQGSVKYTGVPVATTVDVKEQNDITGATYSAVAQNDNDTAKAASAIAKDAVYASNSLSTGTAGSPEATHTIAFTNTLTVISPTGVTLRYAPYFLTLGAGVVALPLTRSYRRREED